MTLTPPQITTLHALVDRLIPADGAPGALEAGTDDFILALLVGDGAAEAPLLALGLTQLDHEAAAARPGQSFSTLSPSEQDALLAAIERNQPSTAWPASISAPAFFNRLVDLAAEGFYADPANGGNRNAVSWRLIGYDPHLPTNSNPP
jgi:hypothetical protein